MIGRSLRVLMYHRIVNPSDVADGESRSLVSATPAEFDRQMRLLASRYRVVSAQEVLDSVHRGKPLPSRAVLLTFDDGYRDFGEIAWPIMRQYGLPATLFVPTAVPDAPGRRFWWDRLAGSFARTSRDLLIGMPCGTLRLDDEASRNASLRTLFEYLKSIPHEEAMSLVESICKELGEPTDLPPSIHSWDELRILVDDGVTVAAHTRTHPALTRMTGEAAQAEIRGARQDLVRELGSSVPIFSYPFGDHNDQVADLVRSEGFKVAVTCEVGHNALPIADPVKLRRTNISPKTTLPVFGVRMTRAGSHIDRWRASRKARREDVHNRSA